ncbi:MAG: DegV family protein, partial [Lachnospiraceae bacterium]|nr:DegV family protein [Lachnospiraceae bacterium]
SIAKAFLFRPVLTLKKGKMGAGKVYFGEEETAIKKYISGIFNSRAPIDTRRAVITYAGLNWEDLRVIEEEVKRRVNFDQIIFMKASSAVTANCGPGTIGVLFKVK